MGSNGSPASFGGKWRNCLAMAEFWAETANLDFFDTTRIRTIDGECVEFSGFPFSCSINGNSADLMDNFFECQEICMVRRIL